MTTDRTLRLANTALRSLSTDGVKQILMGYRHKEAAIEPGWSPKPGFIYTQVRAISARINQNYDAWPSTELKKSYRSFLGKPCFVNHQNEDPSKARGKVIAARYIDAGDDKYVEVIQEIDGLRFPKLAKELIEGGLDSVSMGVEAGFTICSFCGHKAQDEPQFCDHVKYHKGQYLPRRNKKTGAYEDVLVYENCYKLGFFELSYVFEPADETAVASRVIAASKTATYRVHVKLQDLPEHDVPAGVVGHDAHEVLDQVAAKHNLRLEPEGAPNSFGGGGSEYYHAYDGKSGDWRGSVSLHSDRADLHQQGFDRAARHKTADDTQPTQPIQPTQPSVWGRDSVSADTGAKPTPAPSVWGDGGNTVQTVVKTQPQAAPDPTANPQFNPSSKLNDPEGRPYKYNQDNDSDVPSDTAGILRPDTSTVKQIVQDKFPQLTDIGGYRPPDGYNEHSSGEALDVMNKDPHITKQVMDTVFQDPDVNYVLWNQRQWNPDGSVSMMDDRGSPTENHQDHMHINVGAVEQASRVITAARNAVEKPQGALKSMKSRTRNVAKEHGIDINTRLMRSYARHIQGYGEIEAPEDIDTLRDQQGDAVDDYQFVEPLATDEDNPFHHYIESPEELSAPNLDQSKRLDREQETEGLDNDRRVEDVEDVMPENQAGQAALQGRQAMARNQRQARPGDTDYRDAIDQERPLTPHEHQQMSEQYVEPVPIFTGRRRYAESDDELIDEAEDELEKAKGGGSDDSDDDGSGPPPPDDDDSDDDDSDDDDSDSDDKDSGGSKPPWLKGKSDSPVSDSSSTKKSRRAMKGNPTMGDSLMKRGKVASRGRRQHFADESGHTDGGPYGDDASQGVQEEVYISQVPSAEAVEAPADDASNISNTENNLVARLEHTIRTKAADLQQDINAYQRVAQYRTAGPEALVAPDKVDPALSGTDEQSLKGDFEDADTDSVETQPKDASVHAFARFDQWLRDTTGRTASQHGNANYIRRQAASYARAAGVSLNSLFPTLEKVLRHARKLEGGTNMERSAEFDGETVAPDARIDVEAPVKNVTDADAQASQYDLGDFGHNAGDGVADPDLTVDSQIWAPGKEGNRKADAVAAVRYAEAYVNAGLPYDDKWKLIASAQTLRHATVVDRTRLLEAVVEANTQRSVQARRVTAAVSRGTNTGIPQGFASRTASTQRYAENDSANDSAIFL